MLPKPGQATFRIPGSEIHNTSVLSGFSFSLPLGNCQATAQPLLIQMERKERERTKCHLNTDAIMLQIFWEVVYEQAVNIGDTAPKD